MLELIFALGILVFWLTRFPHLQKTSLRYLPTDYQSSNSAKVSLIVAARDEAAAIEANVRSLLAQSYADLELIVVNDRSEDGTAAILDRLLLEFPQLRVIHNKELPAGWLGKCWALHRGAEISQGDWLIFCDGDVLMKSDAVAHALATAEREGYQHLCMAPKLLSRSPWEEAVITSLTLLFYIFQDPRHIFDAQRLAKYMGVGAFNMIHRPLYNKFGGHKALRLEIVDDVFLGMLAKRFGGRSGFFLGLDQASLYWYEGVWAYIRGIEKNSFAGLRFSLTLLVLAIVGQSALFFAPLACFFVEDFWLKICLAASLLLSHAVFAIVCVRSDVAWYRCWALLPAIAVQFFAFSRSAWITLRQGGVRWRGNFYPLAELRQAQKQLRGPLIARSLKTAKQEESE